MASSKPNFRTTVSIVKKSEDQPSYPTGLTEINGNLYYLGNNQLFQMDGTTGDQTHIAGNLLEGYVDGPLLSARFRFGYQGDMTSLNGDLYVADYDNNSVRKITLDRPGAPGQVTTVTGFNRADYETNNESNYSSVTSIGNSESSNNEGYNNAVPDSNGMGHDGSFAQAIVPRPRLITRSGNDLYIVDTPAFRLRKLDMTRKTVTTLRLINNTGIADLERFRPVIMTANETDIYFSTGENVILKVNLSSMALTVFAGEYNRSGYDDGTRLAARFFQPSGLAIVFNNLYVADWDQIRIISLREDRVTTLRATKEGTAQVFQYAALDSMIAGSSGNNLFVSDIHDGYWKALQIVVNPHHRHLALYSLLAAQPYLNPKRSRRNKKSMRQKKTRKYRKVRG